MSQPQEPNQYPHQPPQYGQQPPQYAQPQYQQPQYAQPQYAQPQYQQPLQGRDRAQYVRQQKPHSLFKHLLLCMVGVGLFTIPMYSLSKNHYWTF